jgi:acyl-CoA synthetase (AMP-forming)/AMP-acid ligase II
MNLAMLLDMAAQAEPDRLALGRRADGLTYGRLKELAAAAANWVADQGDRVVYSDLSTPSLPVLLFGASWANRPFVPVNYRLAPDRLEALIATQAPAVLIGPHTVDDSLRNTITTHTTDAASASIAQVAGRDDDWSYEGDDIAIVLHTSGTSGAPKPVVLRQKHLVGYVLGSVDFLNANPEEATLVSVPPYHIAGMAAILTSVYGGRRLVQLPTFDAHEWVATVRAESITHAMVVPTMLARILEVLTEQGDASLPSLRHLSYGGGRMPIPVIEQALNLLPHVNFVNAYGLTETSSSVSLLGPDDHRAAIASDDPIVRARLGSVGQPLPTIELSIRDVDGNEVGSGTQGEVWVRGEQVSGEYGATSSLTNEGWFATKDAGYLDADGYLFLAGRIDDVIVRGGENLSPGEIEDVLLQHPSVREAAVVGISDVQWGEVVACALVAEPDTVIDASDIQAWVAKHLRSARVPAVVHVMPELPYNDTGKLLRRELKPILQALHGA